MKRINPIALQFTLTCDLCNQVSQVFNDCDAILKKPSLTTWSRFFDPNHPWDFPVYYACPTCPAEALQDHAKEIRQRDEKKLVMLQLQEKKP